MTLLAYLTGTDLVAITIAAIAAVLVAAIWGAVRIERTRNRPRAPWEPRP